MKLVSVKMPEALIDGIDELVRLNLYPSRSAVIRAAVRDLLKTELPGWSAGKKRIEVPPGEG
ncbi:MAG: CopG family transcriptional regulator [Candidatus Terraquivivens tikiterensis]|uniref:CopG family transcriptional regulator n=1 Tax=Candidatus Terraquivivens tikiterensis TaxID=1980982 RepID=A0A2R7Y5X5_9ARCH|nr:MAG: CopG family transcriptional regulator [Candidatus Terraquivivens tikiterensis]